MKTFPVFYFSTKTYFCYFFIEIVRTIIKLKYDIHVYHYRLTMRNNMNFFLLYINTIDSDATVTASVNIFQSQVAMLPVRQCY